MKSFSKYEKYTIGEDLRNYSKEILFLVHKANISKDKKEKLEFLRDKAEEVKMLIQLCKEFEISSKMIVDIARQSQAWLNHYARVTN